MLFTELGVAMLSSVLNSERAVEMNMIIMRAFLRLREMIATNKDIASLIEKLERGNARTASASAMTTDLVFQPARSLNGGRTQVSRVRESAQAC